MVARAQGQLTACKSNCKNIATALEMYASDNAGRYPLALTGLLGGNYLKTLPSCPAAKKVTYEKDYQVTQTPDQFSFGCSGNNHGSAYRGFSSDASNFPRYHAREGLIDHPPR